MPLCATRPPCTARPEVADTFDAVARGFSAIHQPPACYMVVGWSARLLGRTDAEGVLWIGRGLALGLLILTCGDN